MHELSSRSSNTALLIGFKTVYRDLSSVRRLAPRRRRRLDRPGNRPDHRQAAPRLVGPRARPDRGLHLPAPDADAWDAYHANSVAITDGQPAGQHPPHVRRSTRSTARPARCSGRSAGGTATSSSSSGARFDFQHDAQPVGDGKMLLFDNGANQEDTAERFARERASARRQAQAGDAAPRHVPRPRDPRRVPGQRPPLPTATSSSAGATALFSEYDARRGAAFDAAPPSGLPVVSDQGDWVGRRREADDREPRAQGRTLSGRAGTGRPRSRYWRVAGGPSRTTLKPLGAPWPGLRDQARRRRHATRSSRFRRWTGPARSCGSTRCPPPATASGAAAVRALSVRSASRGGRAGPAKSARRSVVDLLGVRAQVVPLALAGSYST